MRRPLLGRPLRPGWVLALDLARPVTDGPAADVLSRLVAARRPSLRDVVEALEEAAGDRRVRALIARVDAPAENWAHAQELRDAVVAFRSSGKPAFAHAQSFSEAGEPTLAYLVATGFDEVHLQPSGEVGATGVSMVQPFVADLLDRLDITAQFDHRHEYKTAKNVLTERSFTDAHRESFDRVVASLHEQFLDAVASGRGLDRDRAAALLDRAPLLADRALAEGLVDRLAYRDESVDATKALAGDRPRLVTLARYRASRRRRALVRGPRPTIALVHGHGVIQVGRNRRSSMGPVMGSDSVVAGFQQAMRDKRVRAVVFRVESQGGSAVASDAIWRAVVRARRSGKPVVVSMGGVAGSGGYWVAMGADRIVSAGGTITGSIGVAYGKFVARGLLARLGITTDEVHRGANALMMSTTEPFTEDQWEQIGATLDHIYGEFVDKVAAGRRLDRAQVERVARGRIWTGADAREHGLVDELGGYRGALAAARELAGIAPGRRLRVRSLPATSMAERLGLRPPVGDEARALLSSVAGLVRAASGGSSSDIARVPDWAGRVSRGGHGYP
jgi:protease IV